MFAICVLGSIFIYQNRARIPVAHYVTPSYLSFEPILFWEKILVSVCDGVCGCAMCVSVSLCMFPFVFLR